MAPALYYATDWTYWWLTHTNNCMVWLHFASMAFPNFTVRLRKDDPLNLCKQNDDPSQIYFSHLRSKLWNHVANSDSGIDSYDFNELMHFLKHKKSPNVNESLTYIWHFTALSMRNFMDIYLNITWVILNIIFILVYISQLHWIHHVSGSILALWLMVYVFSMALNGDIDMRQNWLRQLFVVWRYQTIT